MENWKCIIFDHDYEELGESRSLKKYRCRRCKQIFWYNKILNRFTDQDDVIAPYMYHNGL